MSPVSSANEMNSPGGSRSPAGRTHSDHGFDANHLLITKPDQGLILDREFALGQGLRDPGGYREPADVRGTARPALNIA